MQRWMRLRNFVKRGMNTKLLVLTSNKNSKVFVNLIPYNPTLAGDDFGYETPSDDRIYAFHNRLKDLGINSLVRWSSAQGRDAKGACGQLALNLSTVQ